jgi:hypothetical protein
MWLDKKFYNMQLSLACFSNKIAALSASNSFAGVSLLWMVLATWLL